LKTRPIYSLVDAVKEVIQKKKKLELVFNPSLHGPFGTTMDEETIPTFEYIIKIKRL
jgi:N-ethylmaleimide reductase